MASVVGPGFKQSANGFFIPLGNVGNAVLAYSAGSGAGGSRNRSESSPIFQSIHPYPLNPEIRLSERLYLILSIVRE